MKKTFRFLALSFALICGTLSSFAAAPAGGPTPGTLVGNNEELGVVVYEVLGWSDDLGAYEVQINELNWTGIQTKPTEMTIKLAFEQMYGTTKCKYVVRQIKSTTTAEKKAFYAQTNLKKVEFVNDENVIKAKDFAVGDYSFYGCTNLAELIFPDNVSTIGKYAFQNTAIKNFEIPANCTDILEFAFNNCQSLNSVTVREGENGGSLATLGENVFANSTLHYLDLSKAYSLTTIGNGHEKSPFIYKAHSAINNQLLEVKLPEPKGEATTSLLSEIYDSFKNCTSLKSISNLDKSIITRFEDDAFQNDKALAELNFPVGEYTKPMLTGSPFKGCESLATLTFAADFWGTIGDGTNNLFGAVPDDAASLAALKTITFEGYLNGLINSNAFGNKSTTGAICTSLATLTITKGLQAGSYKVSSVDYSFGASIKNGAFNNCAALATVSLNGATIGGADKAAQSISLDGFAATGIKTLDLGDVTISNKYGIGYTFQVNSSAFTSSALESVTVGDINISNGAHYVNFPDGAFVGGANFTSFTVGDINNDGGYVIFGYSGSPVAQSKDADGKPIYTLATVEVGSIVNGKGSQVYFNNNAFQSDALATVTFGDFKKAKPAETTGEYVKIFEGAFAEKNATSETAKTITIGSIAASTQIDGGAFKGGSKAASYTATLGDIKKAKDTDKDFTLAIAAKAFQGPAVGDVTYNFGEVNAPSMTGIAANAFIGAKDKEGKDNAKVNIGAYKASFDNAYTFTQVKEVTVASWETSSSTWKFDKPNTVTVTGDMTNVMEGDNGGSYVENLAILGNITMANSIVKFGSAVRSINFGKDKDIAATAVGASAFSAASNDAKAKNQTINIAYACTEGNEALYNPIFDEKAFGTDNSVKNVVLFTTVWAQNNIFENTTVYPNGIYRMELSASTVIPGEPIKAKLIAGQNGKNMYGKLYIPKGVGMYYKIDAKVSGSKNGVNVFSGHLDNDNIYMKQIDVYKGFYWIDASEVDQVFIVRTSDTSATEVEAEGASDEEIADLKLGDNAKNAWWFKKGDAKKNCLKYSAAKVVNQELQNNAEFMHKTIYVMANPAKYNLAFAKLNQYTTTSDLPAKSLFVLSDTDPEASAARLNVIFEDEIDNIENATAIQNIEAKQAANDGIYNLQGVRVKNAQKGIYIINGKKVIK